jgi:hypothetical protein
MVSEMLLLLIITVIVVAYTWDGKDGMPASEKYKQDTMKKSKRKAEDEDLRKAYVILAVTKD